MTASYTHVAFLGGINLGKRRVKMDELRRHFEGLDVTDVATFIASGNVVFSTPNPDARGLEPAIEEHLESELGFRTESFVRSLDGLRALPELAEVRAAREAGFNPHVIFLKDVPKAGVADGLRVLESEVDRFLILDLEVVWLRKGGLLESPITTRALTEALCQAANTMRNLNTVDRLLAKFG